MFHIIFGAEQRLYTSLLHIMLPSREDHIRKKGILIMNTVFPTKARRLAAKVVVSMFVLVALACVTTPLTAFACDRPHFATILKGFCQVFKADLENKKVLSSDELNEIIDGNSVKGVLESDKGLSDSDVERLERNEIRRANNDFNHGTAYNPEACQQGTRDTATDKSDFQSYFYGQEYAGLDVGYIDSMFTDAIRLAGSSTVNSGNNPGTNNVVEPRFVQRHSGTTNQPCTDTWGNSSIDTTFYTLTVGETPAFCEKVTWNFSNRTVGQDCTFFIKPLNQRFTLKFIDSNGTKHSVTTTHSSTLRHQENDVKQVQLDLSNQSNTTLTLGGMRYECQ